jgi:tetratricopeptide (TPR) repeat protein
MQLSSFVLVTSVLVTSALFLLNSNAYAAEINQLQYEKILRQSLDLELHGDLKSAARMLEDADAQLVKQGKTEWDATVHTLLGTLYQKCGRYADAEESLHNAIYQWTHLKGADTSYLVAPLASLGGLYYEAGEFSLAEKLVTRSLTIQLASDSDKRLTALLYSNLGSIYFSQEKDDLAAQQAEEALKRYALLDDPADGIARNYSLLGALAMRHGQFEEAESYFTKSLKLWQARLGPDDPHTAEGFANLAIFYATSDQPKKAEPLFQKARPVLQSKAQSNAFLRRFYYEFAAAERTLGHKKDARALTREAQRLASTSAQIVISRNVVDASAFR